MSVEEKKSLGEFIKLGTKDMCSDAASPQLVSSPSSSSSMSCDPAVQNSLGSVVGMAVSALAECVEVEEATKAAMGALVSPAPPPLVDAADFECVLCTG